ncbi:hypothetical protein NIES4071_100100 [Calothrix sp. NIES-4071]|nr:hypothetical protein NIES4071_100100 [Calothrix sp. NIES-4071]BAZ64272.1 hypothetical protein NIES4105_100030 [Calothrix sp. NIES-4105]
MPDANFYSACVPRWWTQYRPQFFNCGDRQDVIDTYFKILELLYRNSENSYLSPEKLFAIVDLDLQIKNINDYLFSDAEEIYYNLYQQFRVNEANISQHRIFTTGLIHKEAYFLIPDVQEVVDTFSCSPNYNGKALVLNDIYIDMVDAICDDLDLINNFDRASNRVSCCSGLDCSGINELKDSWKKQYSAPLDEQEYPQLVFALLTIKKAKDYWKLIHPSTNWVRSAEVFREQLLLAIGRFYSEKSDDPKYHIPFLLKSLY